MASSSPAPWLAGMEAVMFYCDTSKATLARVEEVWSRIKEAAPAVCLLVVESASDQVKGDWRAAKSIVLCNQERYGGTRVTALCLVPCDSLEKSLASPPRTWVRGRPAGRR